MYLMFLIVSKYHTMRLDTEYQQDILYIAKLAQRSSDITFWHQNDIRVEQVGCQM